MAAANRRIVITGANGQLGSDLNEYLKSDADVVGLTRCTMDITDRPQVLEKIRHLEPSVVIHAAAYTDVDGCQGNESLAMRVNAEGTDNVASACADVGARMLYISTDYVFDGTKSSAYIETDSPNPQTVYGRSKLAGEQAVVSAVSDYAIVRVAWVYGQHGKNFVKTIITKALGDTANIPASEHAPLKVVDDQIGNPTWTRDIVHQIEVLLKHDISGIVHATSEGEASWFRFACDIFSMLELDVQIIPCTTAEFPRPAPRPRRSTLENARLKQTGINVMRPYRDALAEFLKHYGDILCQPPVR